MKQNLSIWVLSSKSDSNFLSNIIRTLGTKYDAPYFIPHLSIYAGGLKMDLEKAKEIVSGGISGVKPFEIETGKLNQCENIWKTVFVEIKMNKQLERIYENLRSRLITYNDYLLKPHMSLIYKRLPEKERLKIIKNLDIKKRFIIDKIGITSYTDHDDVEKWELTFTKKLL